MRYFCCILLFFFTFSFSYAQIDILQDILETLIEQDPSTDIESIEETLRELQAHPINLNEASQRDLEKIPFLSPNQIDALLLYCHQHPMQNVMELQIIPALKEYEIRNLLPFVYVEPTPKQDDRTAADIFKYAKHELDLRFDVRNMENFKGDPVYGYLKYKLNAGKKVQAGLTFKRDAGEKIGLHSRYGAYVQLNDIWRFKTIVAGDYRASFGLGLVVNTSLPIGKSAYATSLGLTQQGLRKYNGCSNDFLRGVGGTLRLGDVDITAFYSYRKPADMYQQTAGANVSYQKNKLRLGATAVEYFTEKPISLQNTYYNAHYFRGSRQFSSSINGQYAVGRVMLLGEVATSQNDKPAWGWAALMGARVEPIQDVNLLVLLRHYSDTFDPQLGSSFSETSKPNAEQGVYVGAEIKRLRYWRFNVYTDFFRLSRPKYQIRDSISYGADLFTQAEYLRSSRLSMLWRVRVKHKGDLDKLTFRYQVNNRVGDFSFRTQADATLTHEAGGGIADGADAKKSIAFGGLLAEQVEYAPARVPLVLQLRLEGFYIPDYNNRIYAYENDVLYAYSIPMVYGIGARYYANIRYRISDHYSLYLKLSDTWYAKQWQAKQNLPSSHRTDLHLLLRITY